MCDLTAVPKYKTVEQLQEIVRKAQSEGKIVVLGNGAFDLLHVGHVRYLQGARQLGDLLIVAVNSDVSVRTNKGASRPILEQFDRISLVAAIEAVDYVTCFDDAKVSAVLQALKPNIHAKGTDYRTPQQVPEAAVVAEYGGTTALVGDPKDHSTTDIIGKIRSL